MSEESDELKRIAYMSIMLFGFISLFGDIIYEGARGIISPYLEFLGATALIVGVVGGVGEFVGYGLRLASGYIADAKRTYWPFVFLGYGLLISIPLLAFAGYFPIMGVPWLLAALLVIVERIAKALRSPARDTLLSVTTKGVGTGKAFGFHELMDQLGAVIGPILVASVLYLTDNNYFYTFLTLLAPYLALILIIFLAYPRLKPYTDKALASFRREKEQKLGSKFTSEFKTYTFAVFLNTTGLIHVLLILYVASLVFGENAWIVALLYLALQGVDAVAAPISGHMYDKVGRKFLLAPFILSVLPTIFIVMQNPLGVILAVISFGVVLGMQESIYRSAVADLTPLEVRGTAYGIFNTVYGLGFLLSGTIFGIFLDYNLLFQAVVFSILIQILATTSLLYSIKPQT